MALFLSDRSTSASGSIGGTTFAHNRFGQYFRARRKGVNPNTPAQQAQRSAFATGSAQWRTLTQAQRDAWSAYAAATPVKNRLGQTVFQTGAQAYTASASFLLRLAQTPIPAAPAVPGRIDLGTATVVLHSAAGGTGDYTITGTGADQTALFVGDPISAGVLFFAGPYQLAGSSDATAGTGSVTPLTARNGVPLVNGQRVPWRLAGVDSATGRLTTTASGISIVIT